MNTNEGKSKPPPSPERKLRDEAVARSDALIRKAVFNVIDEQGLTPSEAFFVFSKILVDLTMIEMETQYQISGIEPTQ